MNRDRSESEETPTVEVVDYTVGFLDILNQKHHLNNWGTEADIDNNNPVSISAIQKTLGTVHSLRSVISSFIERFNIAQPIPEQYRMSHPERIDSYYAAANSNVNFFGFSDTVILYSASNMERGVAHMKSIYGIMIGMSLTHLYSLADQIAIRGSLEIGLGCGDLLSDLYGPCIASAYQLESEVAKYPRLVVGNGLIDFINKTMVEESDEILSPLNQAMAKSAASLIVTDYDGVNVLDFSGKIIASIYEHIEKQTNRVPRGQSVFEAALKFSKSSMSEFEGRNERLHERYLHLCNYLTSKSRYWV